MADKPGASGYVALNYSPPCVVDGFRGRLFHSLEIELTMDLSELVTACEIQYSSSPGSQRTCTECAIVEDRLVWPANFLLYCWKGVLTKGA